MLVQFCNDDSNPKDEKPVASYVNDQKDSLQNSTSSIMMPRSKRCYQDLHLLQHNNIGFHQNTMENPSKTVEWTTTQTDMNNILISIQFI